MTFSGKSKNKTRQPEKRRSASSRQGPIRIPIAFAYFAAAKTGANAPNYSLFSPRLARGLIVNAICQLPWQGRTWTHQCQT
jgi:hypothetical protein